MNGNPSATVDEYPPAGAREHGRHVAPVALLSVVAVIVVAAVVMLVATPTRLSPPTVPVVGDSLTVLAGHDISTALGDAYHPDIHAKLGQRIDQMLPALGQVLRDHPFAVVVNLGTNDAIQAHTHPDWRSGFEQMVRMLASAHCVVLTTISTLLPGPPARHVASDINRAIATVAAPNRNLHVLDWNAAVHGPNGARLLALDSIHPSTAGEFTLALLIRAALDHDCTRAHA